MKTSILTALMMLMATASFADQGEYSSHQPKQSTAEKIREYAQNCFDRELYLWETKRGRLPTDEEADLIIDACANPKLK